MAASPFAYYRGAALPMAADLATAPRTGLKVQLCGDAHLSNFGGFASPERDLVFDVNDFDETLPGTLRMGPQTLRRQPGGRRPGPGLRQPHGAQRHAGRAAGLPAGDPGVRGRVEP